jgi:hypothetical protein
MKIVSGGQQGSDFAGLLAAKQYNLETGGWLPKGCMTLDGPKEEYLKTYNMKESHGGYAIRTEANVRDSDGTIRFASDFSSAGEKCTLRAINWFKKPHLKIDIRKPMEKEKVINWIKENNIKVLNIAGNTEQTSPGIEKFVFSYLCEVFEGLK